MAEAKKEKKEIHLRFIGIDDFSRPVYKSINLNSTIYFGSTKTLFSKQGKEEVKDINKYFRENLNEIELFGVHFNCEPEGGKADHWEYTIFD